MSNSEKVLRIMYIGCTGNSYEILESLIQMPSVWVVGIITKSKSKFNDNFKSLTPLAVEKNIPYLFWDHTDLPTMITWLKILTPDVIYCFGWSHLLPQKIIQIAPLGAIGYHPTLLPKYRGRHPVIWTLVLGLKETGSTFFFIDEGTDSGDILSQVKVAVSDEDDAQSLLKKLLNVSLIQVEDFTKKLAVNSFSKQTQNVREATYWPKRTKEDGLIRWTMPAPHVYNLVRALTKPYAGAHCLIGSKEVKIWKTKLNEASNCGAKPGQVLNTWGHSFEVQCGTGSIYVLEHDFDHVPQKGAVI